MTTFADMHCHLELFANPRELAQQCAKERLRVLAVTASPRSWRKFNELVSGVDGIRPALGLHPQLGAALQGDLKLFEKFLDETRYVGEIGLDGGREHASTAATQALVLRRVLRMTSEHGGKILSMHSVRTGREVVEMLEDNFDFTRGSVILHWFTGSTDAFKRAKELGCYFSVNSQMLRSENGRTIARSIPSDRLLVETDGPFVMEQGRPASPLQIRNVVTVLAQTRGASFDALAAALSDNLRALVSETTPRQSNV